MGFFIFIFFWFVVKFFVRVKFIYYVSYCKLRKGSFINLFVFEFFIINEIIVSFLKMIRLIWYVLFVIGVLFFYLEWIFRISFVVFVIVVVNSWVVIFRVFLIRELISWWLCIVWLRWM